MKMVRRNSKSKVIIVTILLIILWIAGWYIYNTYINIDITQNDYKVERLQSTVYAEDVENISKKSESLADVIEEVTKSVVGISKLKNTGSSILSNSNESQLGLGTGVIVGSNGYILSNQHLTGEKFSRCYVTLEDGRNYDGTVVWSDTDLDLSIVKINATDLTEVKLGNSSSVRVGESVYAIGNPIGFEFRRTVTSGIISAKNRTIKLEEENNLSYMSNLIQTDATINPGNSGGPLIYPNGDVIGINTVKISSAEGIGFAVPIDVVKTVIESFKKEDKFDEATIGIYAYDKDVIPYLTDNSVKFTSGIYVAQIIANGPASDTDLKEGDVISSFDGNPINSMNELKAFIYTKKPNDKVTLNVARGKVYRDIVITLGKK